MGDHGGVIRQGRDVAMAGGWRGAPEGLQLLTQRNGNTGMERLATAALERYLQIPTFRRQGRRLSCR